MYFSSWVGAISLPLSWHQCNYWWQNSHLPLITNCVQQLRNFLYLNYYTELEQVTDKWALTRHTMSERQLIDCLNLYIVLVWNIRYQDFINQDSKHSKQNLKNKENSEITKRGKPCIQMKWLQLHFLFILRHIIMIQITIIHLSYFVQANLAYAF